MRMRLLTHEKYLHQVPDQLIKSFKISLRLQDNFGILVSQIFTLNTIKYFINSFKEYSFSSFQSIQSSANSSHFKLAAARCNFCLYKRQKHKLRTFTLHNVSYSQWFNNENINKLTEKRIYNNNMVVQTILLLYK